MKEVRCFMWFLFGVPLGFQVMTVQGPYVTGAPLLLINSFAGLRVSMGPQLTPKKLAKTPFCPILDISWFHDLWLITNPTPDLSPLFMGFTWFYIAAQPSSIKVKKKKTTTFSFFPFSFPSIAQSLSFPSHHFFCANQMAPRPLWSSALSRPSCCANCNVAKASEWRPATASAKPKCSCGHGAAPWWKRQRYGRVTRYIDVYIVNGREWMFMIIPSFETNKTWWVISNPLMVGNQTTTTNWPTFFLVHLGALHWSKCGNQILDQSIIGTSNQHEILQRNTADLVVSWNGGTHKSSTLMGFSLINHLCWGTPIYGNPHFTDVDSR